MAAVASSFLIAPPTSQAQPSVAAPTIGFLSPSSLSDARTARLFNAFRQGLRDFGYVEGQTLIIADRWAHGQYERLPDLAAELVRLKVNVIVVYGAAIEAAQHATRTIPIVMAVAQDPVAAGFVASLARPGGNTTGSSTMMPELVGKQLELFKQIVPTVSRVGVLTNPASAANARPMLDRAREVARALGVSLHTLEARDVAGIEAAFAAMTRERDQAVIIFPDAVLLDHRARIESIAARRRLPTISGVILHAEADGLMAYGPDLPGSFQRTATYVDKILKGAKPADLPIEQPTKFELVINLNTAKALGLTIPPSLLARADQVIE